MLFDEIDIEIEKVIRSILLGILIGYILAIVVTVCGLVEKQDLKDCLKSHSEQYCSQTVTEYSLEY